MKLAGSNSVAVSHSVGAGCVDAGDRSVSWLAFMRRSLALRVLTGVLWPMLKGARKPSRRETGGTCCSFIRSPRSSRFLFRQTELDHSSPLLLREPLHTLREIRWNVKLNHFRHSPVLQMAFLRDLTR